MRVEGGAARPVQVPVRDRGVKLRVGRWVRELGAAELVVVCEGVRLVFGRECDQDVSVGQAAHLVLYHVDEGDRLPEGPVLEQVVQQCLQLELEDAAHEVGPVDGGLVGQQRVEDFLPPWVRHHCQEHAGLAVLPCPSHPVVVLLVRVAVAALELGAQDDASADLGGSRWLVV